MAESNIPSDFIALPSSQPMFISTANSSTINGITTLPSTPSTPTIRQQPTTSTQKTTGMCLMDEMNHLSDYQPTIPDAVTAFFLSNSGFKSSDPRVIRLVSLATQKFVSDIANDALQHCKMKGSNVSSKKSNKDKHYTLTMEDLTAALTEYGVEIKKPSFVL